MRGLNKVMVIGNLGRDPEVRYTQSGTCVANLSVAVNEQWKDKDGQRQEKTEWIRCVLWAKVAEVAKSYLHKGDSVYLEGKMQTRSWETNSGETKYTTEVNVHELRMLGGQGNGGRSKVDQPTHPDEEPPVAETDDVPF